jgi:hypothetical protein
MFVTGRHRQSMRVIQISEGSWQVLPCITQKKSIGKKSDQYFGVFLKSADLRKFK